MQALDMFLRQATDNGTVPGAVVCVACRGEVVWHRAYGAAALIPEYHPMQCDTLFDIASLTKVVATTSLLLLAHHESVCHLDDALQHFYPQTRGTPLGSATVRQLLAHTGGLAAWAPLYQVLLPDGPVCHTTSSAAARRHQAIQTILLEPLIYPPGSQMLYSDLGFILLADIVERRYQQPLDRLFRERVAQPLGLHCTGYRPLEGPSPPPASPTAYAATEACPWRARMLGGEVHDENAWAMGGVAGHAGLFGTAHQVWRFAQTLLDGWNGQPWLVPRPTLRAFTTRQESPAGTTWGLGWDTPTPGHSSAGQFFPPTSYGHLGFTGNSVWIDPTRKVIVVCCTNRVHPSRQRQGIRTFRPLIHDAVMRALHADTAEC